MQWRLKSDPTHKFIAGISLRTCSLQCEGHGRHGQGKEEGNLCMDEAEWLP